MIPFSHPVRLVVLLAVLLLAGRPGFAVPACPVPGLGRQPDGTLFLMRLRGDENRHWLEDDKGYTIVKNRRKEWVYALRNPQGALVAGESVVGREDPVLLNIPRNLAPADPPAARTAGGAPRQRSQPGGKGSIRRAPGPALLRNLVLLVEFPNLPHTWSRKEIGRLFNETGYSVDGAAGSVKDYFHEVSYNSLTVESVVTDWIMMDHGFAYYGEDVAGFDARPADMVAEALVKLEARGFDFSALDADQDGEVDGLTVIHAGGGQEYIGNNARYIWSHQWQLPSAVTYDGKRLLLYHTEPERRGWDSRPNSQGLTRIGVICHETGHLLGLPDLYDVDYDSKGAGLFCLMAGGSWNGNLGAQPAHMSAWCKSALGWVQPIEIGGPGIFTAPGAEGSPTVYKVSGAFRGGEYFLLENRQGAGFDAGLPGPERGLLIWHVDESMAHNNNQKHYRVDLEEASGVQHLELNENGGDDGDYFRAGTLRRFGAETAPDNTGYQGQSPGFEILGISASADYMSFTVEGAETGTNPTGKLILRYNCGGGAEGEWEADPGFIRGGVTSRPNVTVEAGEPQAVYTSMRIGKKVKFRKADLPDGVYHVRLHLADLFVSKAGNRRFNVSINNNIMIRGLDVVKRAGGWRKALVVTLPVTVRNGKGLKIVATGLNGSSAILNGIEIIEQE